MPRTSTWHTDTELQAKFGDWWTQEMEFREETTDAEKLATANKELEARGFSERVVDTKESRSGDELEWVLAS